MKTLVLFDFDGTITSKDTFPLFFKFSFNYIKFLLGFFLHLHKYFLHKINIINAETLKLSILIYFLKGRNIYWIHEKGKHFIDYLETKQIIKPEFITKINQFKNQNAEIYVVSASPEIWIKQFCLKHQIKFICTELEYCNHIFVGKFSTKNCNYLEKKNRILNEIQINDYSQIIVYGDSSGDEEMMSLATSKNWVSKKSNN